MTTSPLHDDILKVSRNLRRISAEILPLINNSKKLQYFFAEISCRAQDDAEKQQLSSFERGDEVCQYNSEGLTHRKRKSLP